MTGKPGTYQIHKRGVDGDESDQDLCLVKSDCHSPESMLQLGSCNHCGASKWNILGDSENGYILSEGSNAHCVRRSNDFASVVRCSEGYVSFNLQCKSYQ